MKAFNFFVAIAATLIAVCTAVASQTLFPEPVFVKVQQTPQSPWTCLQCNISCESTGELVCLVTVATSFGGKTVHGRKATPWELDECSIYIPNYQNMPQACGNFPVYDASYY
jgi:hypothetical protein